MKYGVSQGSVLGSLLFIRYVNELFSIGTEDHKMSLADNTSIL